MNDSTAEKEKILSALNEALAHSEKKKVEYRKADELNQYKSGLLLPRFFQRFIVGLILAFLFGAAFNRSNSIDVSFWACMTFVVLPVVFPVIWYAISRYNVLARYKQAEKTISALIDELMTHYTAYTANAEFPVAFKYSSPDVLLELISLISTGRADSIKEALNCFEEDIHRYNMMETQKQIIESTKEVADAATTNALFTAGVYFNTRKK